MIKCNEETCLVRNIVREGMLSEMGDGDRFLFWCDIWCTPVLLQSLFRGFMRSLGKKILLLCIWVNRCIGDGFKVLFGVRLFL